MRPDPQSRHGRRIVSRHRPPAGHHPEAAATSARRRASASRTASSTTTPVSTWRSVRSTTRGRRRHVGLRYPVLDTQAGDPLVGRVAQVAAPGGPSPASRNHAWPRKPVAQAPSASIMTVAHEQAIWSHAAREDLQRVAKSPSSKKQCPAWTVRRSSNHIKRSRTDRSIQQVAGDIRQGAARSPGFDVHQRVQKVSVQRNGLCQPGCGRR